MTNNTDMENVVLQNPADAVDSVAKKSKRKSVVGKIIIYVALIYMQC